jgi:hypothetical protein
MIVGHCPECGQPIQTVGDKVQTCMHTPPVINYLAWLLGTTFDQERRDDILHSEGKP